MMDGNRFFLDDPRGGHEQFFDCSENLQVGYTRYFQTFPTQRRGRRQFFRSCSEHFE